MRKRLLRLGPGIGIGMAEAQRGMHALMDDRLNLVAVIEFHRYRSAMITYGGETRDLRDMYPKKRWPSQSRLMPSPFGECKWSTSSNKPEVGAPVPVFHVGLVLT